MDGRTVIPIERGAFAQAGKARWPRFTPCSGCTARSSSGEGRRKPLFDGRHAGFGNPGPPGGNGRGGAQVAWMADIGCIGQARALLAGLR